MRLTLRTLLAYMDDILDPADKEELAKKIESSGFAEDLIYRTQDTMRRLRLSAPQVMGTGMALDPNTVSEYLDNVLPPDSVGDFERICLESDVHLAEVASSHHVLTMVLGEPADIDPAIRDRMHSIPVQVEERKRLRIEPAHVAPATGQSAAAPAGASPAAPVAAPVETKAELPDYLRTSSWSRHRVALTAAAVLLLAAVAVVLAAGSRGWFGGGEQMAAAPAAGQTAEPRTTNPELTSTEPSAGDEGAVGGVPIADTSSETATGEAAESTASSAPPTSEIGDMTPPATDAGEGGEATAETPVETPAVPAAVDGTTTAAAGGADMAESGGAPAEDAVAMSVPGTAAGTAPAELASATSSAAGAAPETSDAGPGSLPPETGDASAGASDEASVPAPEPITELGTYLGGKVVLLHYDEAAGAWFRLAARSVVTNGERLLALPAFRPKVTLASGVHVDLSGGTQIVVRTADAAEASGLPGASTSTPALELIYGRIVLINTANEDNQVVLKLGPTVADVKLARGATLAAEVERSYVPGRDPRKSPAPVVARLYAREGEVQWRVGDSETTIREPAHWTIADGVVSAIAADAQPPEWIDQEPSAQRSEQLYAAPVIEESLGYDQPADNQLLELYQAGRRREVKSLAARSSIHVGLFVPFIEALRDSDQRPNWRTHIEALRAAMALSPESADKVWQALVEQRGEKAAADLFEMLCGYNQDQIGHTPEQIDSGALAQLIDRLEDDNLDYRVLAVNDLREITGKNLLSNPAGSLNERALGVRRWRERLKSGELVPLEGGQRESP